MKKSLLPLLFLSFTFTTFSQSLPDTTITKYDYLEKSVRKEKTGNILLGIGGGLLLIAGLTSSTLQPDGTWTAEMVDMNLLSWAGFTACAASIPFYISEGKNKRKSSGLAFGSQGVLSPQHGVMTVKAQPAVMVRVGL